MKQKLSLLTMVALFISVNVFCQLRKIPATVTDAFAAKYPNAKKVEWKDAVTNFHAKFEQNGKKHEAVFTADGKWTRTEIKITQADLPAAVKDGFNKSKYRDWSVKAVYIYEYADKEKIYFLRVKKNDIELHNLEFNAAGQLVKEAITL